MNRYHYDVMHISSAGERSSLYRLMDRAWPSAPAAGDVVSLGGGDLILEPVVGREFRDGWVVLSFLIKEDETDVSLQTLTDLGFAPLPRPQDPPALG